MDGKFVMGLAFRMWLHLTMEEWMPSSNSLSPKMLRNQSRSSDGEGHEAAQRKILPASSMLWVRNICRFQLWTHRSPHDTRELHGRSLSEYQGPYFSLLSSWHYKHLQVFEENLGNQ